MPEPNLPDLAEVLAEVNRLRAEHGMKPLSEMPKGTHICYSCPLAHAFGGGTAKDCVYAAANGQVNTPRFFIPSTPLLRQFVRAFDAHRYPELEVPE